MKTIHHWFRSGNYTLLGHIDFAEAEKPGLGVLIIPPFGWEDVCSYRPLRFLGKTIAEAGIAAMRFDLPGTGNSSGELSDTGLFDAWIQAVDDAANELHEAAQVDRVAA